MKKPSIICVANHKGGCGKSSISVNLAHTMLEFFNHILVLDFDPQGNATQWLYNDSEALEKMKVTFPDVLRHGITRSHTEPSFKENLKMMAAEATINIMFRDKRISLIPSGFKLSTVKTGADSMESIANGLFKTIETVRCISEDYDLVIIDTPPSTEFYTWAPIAAADYVLIPLQLNRFALNGADTIMESIYPSVKRYYNRDVKILGIAINMWNRTQLAAVTMEAAQKRYGDLLFKTIISRSVKVEEGPMLGQALIGYSSNSKSAREFIALTHEIYERMTGTALAETPQVITQESEPDAAEG